MIPRVTVLWPNGDVEDRHHTQLRGLTRTTNGTKVRPKQMVCNVVLSSLPLDVQNRLRMAGVECLDEPDQVTHEPDFAEVVRRVKALVTKSLRDRLIAHQMRNNAAVAQAFETARSLAPQASLEEQATIAFLFQE